MKHFFLSLAFLGFLFLLPTTLNAQTIEAPSEVVAKVRIQNCTLAQEANNLNIACDFTNAGESTVTDIRYALEFLRGNAPLDTQVFTESFSLSPQRTYHKEISYPIPTYLEGTYDIILKASNQEGLPLGINSLGTITTTKTGENALIQTESCTLVVEGKEETKYTLSQGVDIALSENLIGRCMVTNQSQNTLTLTPVFTTHHRTVFGEKVSTQSHTPESLTLSSNESQEYTFLVPKGTLPQAYDTTLTFTKDNQPITNTIIIHSVIQGASATIHTITSDKTFYQTGDKATITTFWTGSADSFPDSRGGGTTNNTTKLHLTIKTDNTLCGEAIKDISSSTTKANTDLTVSITNTCVDPIITLQILDTNNQVLAERTVTIPSDPQEQGKTSILKDSLATHWLKLLIAFLIILPLVIYLIAHLNKKSPKRFALLFLPLLVTGLFLGGTQEVRGDTFSVTASDGIQMTYSLNLDKSTYAPNENIKNDMSVSYARCSNGSEGYGFDVVNLPKSSSETFHKEVPSVGNGGGCAAIGISCSFTAPYIHTDSTTFTAPSTNGSYAVRFKGATQWYTFTSGGVITGTGYNWSSPIDIPYSVGVAENGSCGSSNNSCSVGTLNDTTDDATNYLWDCTGSGGGTTAYCSLPKPVSGTCGGANGVAVASAPTSGFCSTGTSSGVSGTGPWNWNCNGSGGGSNASCSAPLSGGGGGGAVNGTCGSSNGGSFSSAPGANLCNAGTTAWTDSTASDNIYNWNCTGSGGGSTASCTANKTTNPPAGACGASNGQDAWSAPTSWLCNAGTPSAVSGSGPWSWSCAGSSTAYCSAPKGPPTPSVTLTINGTAVSNNYYGGGIAPTIDVASGDNLNLVWSSVNTTSCQALAPSPGWMTNPKATGGNDNVTATVSGDYTIQCIGAPAASGGNYVAAAKITINVTNKLTVCKDSCNSSVRRGLGGTTSSATYTANQTENWVACYSSSQNCTDSNPAANVTTSTTWGEQGGNTAAALSGTNPKVMTMSSGGTEALTATYNNNITSSPFNSYYDVQTNYSTWPFTYEWVEGGELGGGNGLPKLGGGTPPNWTPAGLGVAVPSGNAALNAPSYQSNGISLVSSNGAYPAYAGSWNTWRLIANQKAYNETATINVGATCTDSGACQRDPRSQNLCANDTFTVTDSCGVTQTCSGSKSCDFNWKEVAPN